MFVKLFKPLLIVVMSIFMIPGIQSCQPLEYRAELKKVDSLQQMVHDASEILTVDQSRIQSRFDSIQIRLNYIGEHMPEISREQQNLLTDYRSVWRAYRYFLQNYEGVVNANEVHEERINNLKSDVRAGHIDKDDFPDIYEEERKILQEHKFNAREMMTPVIEVESMYLRTHEQVHNMYLELLASPRVKR